MIKFASWRLAIVLLTFSLLSGSALAQNYSGWWWNPAESGRGISLEHQGDTVFAGVYLYDDAGNPLWATFSATLVNNGATAPLSTLTGPAMGQPYDPAQVEATQIGTATIAFIDNNNATLSYDAGGFVGPATVTRFTFVALPLDGRFKTLLEIVEHCDSTEVGDSGEFLVTTETSGSTLTLSMREDLLEETNQCELQGDFSQAGGRIVASGTLNCTERTPGGALIEEFDGTWSTDNLTVTDQWFHATVDATLEDDAESCPVSLKFGGMRSDLVWTNP